MRFVIASMAVGGAGALCCSDTLAGALALTAVVTAVVACLVQDLRETPAEPEH